MSLLETCAYLRKCWDAVFLSRYVSFLEQDNARLRAQVGRLEVALSEQRHPVLAATPAEKKNWEKVPMAVNNQPRFWDANLRLEARKTLFADELEPKQEEATSVAQEN